MTFYGVRGSTPSSSSTHRRYGSNTSCVVVEVAGEPPIVFDLGTGLRRWGDHVDRTRPFQATALVTHLHWDHVQGLPFLEPLHHPGSSLDLYAPAQADGDLEEVFDRFMGPPFFPIHARDLGGRVAFHEVLHSELRVGEAEVLVRPVPHQGPTVGYRVHWHGVVIAYVSDHHALPDQTEVSGDVLELCRDADLLVHEAQYTAAQWESKAHWGHCTVDFALLVAQQAGARRLAMFHHDPSRSDDQLDELGVAARKRGAAMGIAEVTAAAEGDQLTYPAR